MKQNMCEINFIYSRDLSNEKSYCKTDKLSLI